MYYLDDIFNLKKEKVSELFSNTLLNYAIIPCLLNTMKKDKKGWFIKNKENFDSKLALILITNIF